jgi:hypothetical protein
MKGILANAISGAACASRSLWVIATVAISCVVPLGTTLNGAELDHANDLFYTTSGAGAELFAISVRDGEITTTDIGPTNGGNCASLALSPSGTLYSMCGPLFGTQKLATINPKTGLASLFGVPVPGLTVMAMTFAPNGILYAVGDCNPDATFECTPGSDPHYNSLYRVNKATGAFTRVGSTGAPQFFMDLAFDRNGNMFGVTTTVNPSTVPAILYRIDPANGAATQIFNLVGSNSVMGLAFDREDRLYATDFAQNSALYLIDIETGFETAIAALPLASQAVLRWQTLAETPQSAQARHAARHPNLATGRAIFIHRNRALRETRGCGGWTSCSSARV